MIEELYRTYDTPPYDTSRTQLIANLVEPTIELQDDTEDFIREWLLSNPQVGDVLHESLNDLAIERIQWGEIMMPEKLQILQDQYESALIKVAKAEAKLDEILRHKQYLNTLHGEYLDEKWKALGDQRELLHAIKIVEELKEKGVTDG